MSRKHFIKLAAAIAQIQDNGERERMAKVIAEVCAAQNARFSYDRFYAACKVSGY